MVLKVLPILAQACIFSVLRNGLRFKRENSAIIIGQEEASSLLKHSRISELFFTVVSTLLNKKSDGIYKLLYYNSSPLNRNSYCPFVCLSFILVSLSSSVFV